MASPSKTSSKLLGSAKRLKTIGEFTEAEILSAMTSFSVDDQSSLAGLSKRLWESLQKTDTRTFEKPQTKKKLQKVTEAHKLVSIVDKIEKVLLKYEESPHVDKWDFRSFENAVGESFDSLDELQIIEVHRQLINVASAADKIRLVTFVERGRLYDYLKFSEDWSGRWEELCSSLEICSKTANRYIDFFKIIQAYPRLLICELSFETVVSIYKQLRIYLIVHPDLEG